LKLIIYFDKPINLKIMKKFNYLIILVSLIFASCAGSYHNIQPHTLNYVSSNSNEDIMLEYKYALLNKKYSKKQFKRNVKIAAVKITNNSEDAIVIGEDVQFVYENGNNINLLSQEETFRSIKQKPALHLLYLLLTFLTLQVNNNDPIPIGYGIGPGLAFGNLLAANSANQRFLRELEENNIINKSIQPGESAFGVIGIKSTSSEGISLAFK